MCRNNITKQVKLPPARPGRLFELEISTDKNGNADKGRVALDRSIKNEWHGYWHLSLEQLTELSSSNNSSPSVKERIY